jgi:CDP-paratose 2-epimerase
MNDRYLITGGAGFIGSNYAWRLIEGGAAVTIFDNLSRGGAESNLVWLEKETGKKSFEFIKGDVRNFEEIKSAAAGKEIIIHLAAQVAVTTSVENPRHDFEVNAGGTFNVLEAARLNQKQPIVIYASTNKVYGELEDLEIIEEPTRYQFKYLKDGIDESRSLDFHSPYGCSKGAGDQYVRDYARIYEIPTIVFRQSCIYGTRQFGIEDQGWVAWFVIAVLKKHPLKIYGNGKQIRDLLFVDDLLDAYDLAIKKTSTSKGQVYNVGGGPKNSISIWMEFSKILEEISGHEITVEYHEWRPGDQKVYVSNIKKCQTELGWNPKIDVREGLARLYKWASENKDLFA